MLNHVIDASLTTQSVTFRPGGPPASFGVIVINRSQVFASFQLEILVPGTSQGTSSSWYRLTPEVSAAKPPGDRTDFQIEIYESPLPAFAGTVNLTVRVSSPQLIEERRLVLRLTVEPGEGPGLLRVDLPTRRFPVYPRNSVEIPVTVQNLGARPAEVLLTLKQLNPTWIVGSPERRLAIEPGSQAATTFQCQPPAANQAPSQDYQFEAAARGRDGATGSALGIVEVLPIGFVQFEVQPLQQQLPVKGGWLPDWWSEIAIFQLRFKNASNLLQEEIRLKLRGSDCRRCQMQVDPDASQLPPWEETPAELLVKPKRPWVGRVQVLQFEAEPLLSDRRLGSTDPETQLLTLKVFPILPLGLLLAVLALLIALLLWLLQPTPVSHTAVVNAVRFGGLVSRVLSGSDDCTVRSWQIPEGNERGLQPSTPSRFLDSTTACNKSQTRRGLLAVPNRAVRALAIFPTNDQLVFAGLENGDIVAWDIVTGEQQFKPANPAEGDRVFDLVFTRNAEFLYAGHGKGAVRVWRTPAGDQIGFQYAYALKLIKDFDYQVRSLALSPDETLLLSAGSRKQLIVWDRTNAGTVPKKPPQRITFTDLPGPKGVNDYIWSVVFAPRNLFPDADLLAFSDSDGNVALWNVRDLKTGSTPKPTELDGTLSDLQEQEWRPIEQTGVLRDRRQTSSNQAVRSLKFTPDGRRLIGARDDGRIVAWTLTTDGKFDQTTTEQVIYDKASDRSFSSAGSCRASTLPLNSIDVDSGGTWVASGGADCQVRLHRLTLRR
jgi:WD40 repeat protein